MKKLSAQSQERLLLSGGTFLFMILFILVLDFLGTNICFASNIPNIPLICVNEKSHDVFVKFLSLITQCFCFFAPRESSENHKISESFCKRVSGKWTSRFFLLRLTDLDFQFSGDIILVLTFVYHVLFVKITDIPALS